MKRNLLTMGLGLLVISIVIEAIFGSLKTGLLFIVCCYGIYSVIRFISHNIKIQVNVFKM